MGVILGAFVTAMVQSSSATTVMVVGFVNAGVMKLTQAVAVIMGANIGTTITAQMVSFDLEAIAPLAVGLGVAVWLFASNRKVKTAAEIVIGFGILFIGMDFMKDAMKPLRDNPAFVNLLQSFQEPGLTNLLLAILSGFAITAIVQSSSATTAILVGLASQGLLPIGSAFPILLGTNIGTCVTAMLSSVGANKTAKRAALVHLLFNVIGTLIFIIFFRTLTLDVVQKISSDPKRQLANAHTIFNVVNTLMLLPFAKILVNMVQKILPYDEEEEKDVVGIKYIDDRILETPSIAVGQVMKEVLHMGNITKVSYEKAVEAFLENSEKKIREVFKLEKIINKMERDISSYLLKIAKTDISASQRDIVEGLFNIINDIERVGDHADNLAELALYMKENKLSFSEKAQNEVKVMHERVFKSYSEALTAMKTGSVDTSRRVVEREGEIDHMVKTLRANHIRRMRDQLCTPGSGVIFLDMISNLERIGDHCSNIALAVMDNQTK